MNELPRTVLCELIRRFGPALYTDPLRCRNLLRDGCRGEYKREIHVLVIALEEQVVESLLKLDAHEAWEVTIARLAHRLEAEKGITEEAACWSVQTWAVALNLVSEVQLPVTAAIPTPSEQTADARGIRPIAAAGAAIRPVPTTSNAAASVTSPKPAPSTGHNVACVGMTAAGVLARSAKAYRALAALLLLASYGLLRYVHADMTRRSAESHEQRANLLINGAVARLVGIQERQKHGALTTDQAQTEATAIRQQCEQALQHANRAVALDAHNRTAWLQRVRALFYVGQYQEAHNVLLQATALFPDDTDLLPLKAMVDSRLNRGS